MESKKLLVKRMRNRILVESAVEYFFRQVYKNHDYGGAKEWMDSDYLELTLEKYSIFCRKKDNIITLDNEEFSYDFSYITGLCSSLLRDKIEV
jgi:hypothetical protein